MICTGLSTVHLKSVLKSYNSVQILNLPLIEVNCTDPIELYNSISSRTEHSDRTVMTIELYRTEHFGGI